MKKLKAFAIYAVAYIMAVKLLFTAGLFSASTFAVLSDQSDKRKELKKIILRNELYVLDNNLFESRLKEKDIFLIDLTNKSTVFSNRNIFGCHYLTVYCKSNLYLYDIELCKLVIKTNKMDKAYL